MLHGIALLKWDRKYGLRVEASYPESLTVEEQILKQVYTNHEFEEEAGFLSISISELNIASYYTGTNSDFYLIALLSIDEIPEDYEDILIDTVRLIMSNIKGRRYRDDLPFYFKAIETFPNMTKEQRHALILLDPIKKMIIDRLIEDGTVSKSELAAWLRDKFGGDYIDLDSIINSLLRAKVLREETLEEMTSSTVFLIGDIFVSRIPPKASLVFVKGMTSLEPKITKNYFDDVRTFFENYSPNPEDQDEILRIITDMDCYKIITRLRTAPLSQNSKIYAKVYEEMKNFNEVLKRLWEAQVISVLKDKKGVEHLFLRSDIAVRYVFPEYLVNKIRSVYYEGSKAENILLEYLRILQDRYYDYKNGR